MRKTYKEQLNFAEENNLSVFDLTCAQEVKAALLEANEPELDEEFENLCWQTGEAYFAIEDLKIYEAALAIVKLRKDGYTYRQISDNRYALVEKYID